MQFYICLCMHFFPDELKGFEELHCHGRGHIFHDSVLYSTNNLLWYMGCSAFSLFHSNASYMKIYAVLEIRRKSEKSYWICGLVFVFFFLPLLQKNQRKCIRINPNSKKRDTRIRIQLLQTTCLEHSVLNQGRDRWNAKSHVIPWEYWTSSQRGNLWKLNR